MSSKPYEPDHGVWRRLMPKSITARLTLLYSASVLVILALSGLAVYATLSANFDREDSDFLASRIAVAAAILEKDPAPQAALEVEVSLGTAAHRYALNYVRVLDGDGRIVAETPGMGRLLPAALFSALTPGSPAQVTSPAGGRPYLAGVTVLPPAGARIEAALDVSQEAELDARVRTLLFAILAGGLALAMASGWLVTLRGLKPLGDIARTARRITATNLDERLGRTAWPTELAVLSEVFDDMLARLQTSFRRLSDFSANLAHELRTPINNLMGEAEVALVQERTPEEYRQHLASATEEYARLARLVDNLLFLARTDGAVRGGHRQEVDIAAAVAQVCDYYAMLAEDREVAVTCRGRGTVEADQTLLQRAVGNLLSNALRYTPPGGCVDIVISEAGGGTSITVTDTGTGIAAEDIGQVFERFYRADTARSAYPEGTGLGLSIVKSIMDLHGGTAEIDSIPGAGTSVRLMFPAKPLEITEL